MQKFKKHIMLFLLALIVLSFQSCKEDNPVQTSSKKTYPTPLLLDTNITTEDVYVYLMNLENKYNNPFDNSEMTTYQQTAMFYSDNSVYNVDAGTVNLNNAPLEKSVILVDSITNGSGVAYSDYRSINWGQNYTWNISGSSDIQAFSVTVATPAGSTIITSPSRFSSLSKSQNLTITWSGTYDTANKVRILLSGPGGVTKEFDFTDSGTCTIPSNELTSYSNGNGTIELLRGRYSIYNLSNGKKAFAVNASCHEIPVTLGN